MEVDRRESGIVAMGWMISEDTNGQDTRGLKRFPQAGSSFSKTKV